MEPDTTTTTYGPSLLELLGIYPAILVIIAITLGIIALVLRRRTVNVSIAHGLVAVGLFGFGTTAWRIHEMNSILRMTGTMDPLLWINDLGYAWMASAFVLPAVAIGFVLLAISWVFTKQPKQ